MRFIAENKKSPWFITFIPVMPHHPYTIPFPQFELYSPAEINDTPSRSERLLREYLNALHYADATLGELVAWIIGWDLILEYAVGNVAVAIAWSGYFASFLRFFGIEIPYWLCHSYRDVAFSYPEHLGDLPIIFGHHVAINIPSIVIVGLITWLLVIGVKESARVNNVMVALKLSVLALFIGVGFFYIEPKNWVPFAPNGWRRTR